MAKTIKKVNISKVQAGDIVLCADNVERTICAKDIKKGFMGFTLWGDSYCLGHALVELVKYEN